MLVKARTHGKNEIQICRYRRAVRLGSCCLLLSARSAQQVIGPKAASARLSRQEEPAREDMIARAVDLDRELEGEEGARQRAIMEVWEEAQRPRPPLCVCLSGSEQQTRP